MFILFDGVHHACDDLEKQFKVVRRDILWTKLYYTTNASDIGYMCDGIRECLDQCKTVYEHAEAPQYPRPIDVHDLVSGELLVDPAYMINRLKRYTELSVKPKQRLYKLYREDPTDKRAWLNPFYQLAIGDKKVLRQNVEFAANNGLKWVDN